MPTKMHPLGKLAPVKGAIDIILRDNVGSSYYGQKDIAIIVDGTPFQACTEKLLKSHLEDRVSYQTSIKMANLEYNTLILHKVRVPSRFAPSSMAERLNGLISPPVCIQDAWPSRLTKFETRSFNLPSVQDQAKTLKKFEPKPIKLRVYRSSCIQSISDRLSRQEAKYAKQGIYPWWRACARAWPVYFNNVLSSGSNQTRTAISLRNGANTFITYGLEDFSNHQTVNTLLDWVTIY